MDTEELRQKLKQPKFRQKLEQLGVDIDDLEQQLEVGVHEENPDYENQNPVEINEGNEYDGLHFDSQEIQKINDQLQFKDR